MRVDVTSPDAGRAPRRLSGLVLTALAVVALAPGAGAEPPPAQTLRVNQVAVRQSPTIELIVTPPRELSLLNLQAADFTVRQAGRHGQAQVDRLRDQDLALAIVVDLAGSNDEVSAARGAALELIRRLPVTSPVVVLGNEISARPGAPALSVDKSAALDTLAQLPAGTRPVTAAVRDATAILLAGASSRPTVVVVSGAPVAHPLPPSLGSESQGPKWRRPAYYLATVGSTAGTDSSAYNGGGPVAVERPSQLIGATDQITTELSSQYHLSYPSAASTATTITVAVSRAGVVAEATVSVPAVRRAATPANHDRPAAVTPVSRDGRSGVRTAAMVLISLLLLAGAAWFVMVVRRRRATGSSSPATAADPPIAAVATTAMPAPSPAPPPATVVARADVGHPSVHLDDATTAAARAADKGLERLAGQLAALPAHFPLQALVVGEVVANAASAGSRLTVAGAFRDLNALPAEMNGSAWVPRWTRAMESGFDQARVDGFSAVLLTLIAADVKGGSPDDAVRPPESLVARLGALRQSGPGPSVRAALAYLAVVSEWPEPELAEVLGRFALILSLAADGALRQPVLDVSEQLGRQATGTPNGNHTPEVNSQSDGSALLVIDAISAASALAATRLSALEGLRRKWLANSAVAGREQAPAALDAILANPIITAAGLARRLGVGQGVAEGHIVAFAADRFLRPIGSSSHIPYWVAPAVLAIVADDLVAPPRALAHTTRS